ncbi:MAG TPA: hypothetical protein VHG51_16395 [Longimicrobiaceae bacterium]|nr:hypothetical protein [Longimicrobiaceae bacterium]
MNKQVYDTAYRRTLEGKSSRTLWDTVLAPFESVEDRMSREAGERDARAALAENGAGAQTEQPQQA